MLGRTHWDVHRPVDILQGGKYLGQYAICAFTVQVFRPAYLVIHSQVRLRQLSKELSPTVHLYGKSVRPHPGFPGPAKQLQPLAAGRIVESQVLDGVGPFVNGKAPAQKRVWSSSACHLMRQQPRPVLGERRLVEGTAPDVQVEEPPEEHVVGQPFAELALRAHGVERVQQARIQQVFGQHVWAAPLAYMRLKVGDNS